MFAEITGEILYVMGKVNKIELFMENFWPEKKEKTGQKKLLAKNYLPVQTITTGKEQQLYQLLLQENKYTYDLECFS